jgi:AbrB family looped-hinge helix DNA binding protein
MPVLKKITPVGNSRKGRVSGAVIIPKPFLEQLGIGLGSKVEVHLESDRIVIKPAKEK